MAREEEVSSAPATSRNKIKIDVGDGLFWGLILFLILFAICALILATNPVFGALLASIGTGITAGFLIGSKATLIGIIVITVGGLLGCFGLGVLGRTIFDCSYAKCTTKQENLTESENEIILTIPKREKVVDDPEAPIIKHERNISTVKITEVSQTLYNYRLTREDIDIIEDIIIELKDHTAETIKLKLNVDLSDIYDESGLKTESARKLLADNVELRATLKKHFYIVVIPRSVMSFGGEEI
jgi:hypothetical protein